MNVFILLFLFIVVTCQAYLSPLNRHLVARQGVHEFIDATHDNPEFKELKEKAKNYVIDDAVDPDLQLLIVPDVYKPKHLRSSDLENRPSVRHNMNHLRNYYSTPSRFNNAVVYQNSYPVFHSRSLFNEVNNRNSDLVPQHQYHESTEYADHTKSLINESIQLRKEAQAEQAAQLQQLAKSDREARLEAADKEALNQLSEDDRNILQAKLTLSEREELLDQLENGELDEVLPREENRFGVFGAGGLSNAASQIGASAGGFIGRKLAGTLGAKLGAAAGAYLGAAAASRFVKKTKIVSNIVSNLIKDPNIPVSATAVASASAAAAASASSSASAVNYGYGGGYGAVLLRSK